VSTAYYGYYKYDVTVVGVYVCHRRVASTVLLRAWLAPRDVYVLSVENAGQCYYHVYWRYFVINWAIMYLESGFMLHWSACSTVW